MDYSPALVGDEVLAFRPARIAGIAGGMERHLARRPDLLAM